MRSIGDPYCFDSVLTCPTVLRSDSAPRPGLTGACVRLADSTLALACDLAWLVAAQAARREVQYHASLGPSTHFHFFPGVAYKALRLHYKLIISGFQGVAL